MKVMVRCNICEKEGPAIISGQHHAGLYTEAENEAVNAGWKKIIKIDEYGNSEGYSLICQECYKKRNEE